MSAPLSVNARNSVEINNNTCCPFFGRKKHKHKPTTEKVAQVSNPIKRRDAQDPLPSSPSGLHAPTGFLPGGQAVTYGNMPAVPEGSK